MVEHFWLEWLLTAAQKLKISILSISLTGDDYLALQPMDNEELLILILI